MTLISYSEPVSPTGSLAGSGAVRVLGRPKLSSLALVLRESIQNSWDARNGERQVRFSIERRMLSNDERSFISEHVFPGSHRLGIPVARTLRSRPEILLLTDQGTVGLGGPVRANEVVEDEPRRFVDFFRNIGSHQEVAGSGGTYGFGKTSLYRLSRSRSIAVFTRARPSPGSTLQARFMAAGIGDSFKMDGKWYTGRHWWGTTTRRRDPVVDPVIDTEAIKLADALGMLFSYNEAGTSIAILSPDIEDGADFRREVVETLLYNFWPKMLDSAGGQPAIAFSFTDGGEDVSIPSPRDFDRVAPFVDAYSRLGQPSRAVMSQPIQVVTAGSTVEVGTLSYRRTAQRSSTGARKRHWEPFGELTHHVCLLRSPELVVCYEKTQPPLGSEAGYAAVFRVHDEYDHVFASAEPPSHDTWEPSGLSKRDREIVNRTMKEIRQHMKRLVEAQSAEHNAIGAMQPLGRLASFLGELLDGVDADGPQVFGSSTPGDLRTTNRAHVSRPKVEVLGARIVSVVQVEQSVVAEVDILVKGARAGQSVRVKAVGGVQTADGLESDAPEGEPTVDILRWRDERGVELSTSGSVVLSAKVSPSRLCVVARIPETLLGSIAFYCDIED